MKLGMTRWKMVPLYRGTPFTILPVLGSFHSLVPVDSPMKLATVSGAWSGNSVQVMLPAVVSMVAVVSFGCAGVPWAAFSVFACCADVELVFGACAVATQARPRHR